MRRTYIVPFLVAAMGDLALAATYTVLHSFTGVDGDYPVGVSLSGSTLFGTTTGFGAFGFGTIFRVNTDGAGFSVLHDFSSDEASSFGTVVVDGTTIYGDVRSNTGDVYRISTDGTGFQSLHDFSLDSLRVPNGLTQSGSTLFGVALQGRLASSGGGVYKLNTDGTGYEPLHEFAQSASGSVYAGAVAVSGATLFGTTRLGGASDQGMVYRVNTDGSGFEVLHSFDGTAGNPVQGRIVTDGSTLYGTTDDGIFKIGADGGGFEFLHFFTRVEGTIATTPLTLSGGKLYGGTLEAIFEINTDGSDFQLLRQLSSDDGVVPQGSLVVDGLTVYGTNAFSGEYDHGTIFALTVPEPRSWILLGTGASWLLFLCLHRGRRDRKRQ